MSLIAGAMTPNSQIQDLFWFRPIGLCSAQFLLTGGCFSTAEVASTTKDRIYCHVTQGGTDHCFFYYYHYCVAGPHSWEADLI